VASGSAAPAGGVRPHGHFGGVEWALTAMVALIWGASFLFIKMGVESFGAGLVPAMRIGFGGLALVCVPASHRPIDRRDWPAIVLLALIWMAVPFLLFSIAEETVPTAVTGMINGAVRSASPRPARSGTGKPRASAARSASSPASRA